MKIQNFSEKSGLFQDRSSIFHFIKKDRKRSTDVSVFFSTKFSVRMGYWKLHTRAKLPNSDELSFLQLNSGSYCKPCCILSLLSKKEWQFVLHFSSAGFAPPPQSSSFSCPSLAFVPLSSPDLPHSWFTSSHNSRIENNQLVWTRFKKYQPFQAKEKTCLGMSRLCKLEICYWEFPFIPVLPFPCLALSHLPLSLRTPERLVM